MDSFKLSVHSDHQQKKNSTDNSMKQQHLLSNEDSKFPLDSKKNMHLKELNQKIENNDVGLICSNLSFLSGATIEELYDIFFTKEISPNANFEDAENKENFRLPGSEANETQNTFENSSKVSTSLLTKLSESKDLSLFKRPRNRPRKSKTSALKLEKVKDCADLKYKGKHQQPQAPQQGSYSSHETIKSDLNKSETSTSEIINPNVRAKLSLYIRPGEAISHSQNNIRSIFRSLGDSKEEHPLGGDSKVSQSGRDSREVLQFGSDLKEVIQFRNDSKEVSQYASDSKEMFQSGSDSKVPGCDSKKVLQFRSDSEELSQSGSDSRKASQCESDSKEVSQSGNDSKEVSKSGSDSKVSQSGNHLKQVSLYGNDSKEPRNDTDSPKSGILVDAMQDDYHNCSALDAKTLDNFISNRLDALENHIYFYSCELNAISPWTQELSTALSNLARRRNVETCHYLALRYNSERRIPLFEIRQQFVEIFVAVGYAMRETLEDVRNKLSHGNMRTDSVIIERATSVWDTTIRHYNEFRAEFYHISSDYTNFADVWSSMERHYTNFMNIFSTFHESIIDLFERF